MTLVALLLVSAFILLIAPGTVFSFSSSSNPCQLANGIQHVIYIQFDNVHFTRDNPNVPSDLEQMPALLNFLDQNGVLATNQQTPMISHTADDIVTSITGLYGDEQGIPVANDYGYYQNGNASNFQSSFAYWTDRLNPLGSPAGTDTTYNMITAQGLNTPAPWVAFTRAGCNYGAVAMANTELESLFPDVPTVFGASSPQVTLANNYPDQASADFEGIAVHCAATSAICSAKNGGVSDILPDEPGGYHGFSALFGAKYVDQVISPGTALRDLSGNVIQDVNGDIGFPGYDSMTPAVSLAYVAAMQEHGIPVTFAYIADAHDNHVNDTAFGPGQAGYEAQLAAYNSAFATFFARLTKDGITTKNTLFVITADEGDHVVVGPPTPANCNGATITCSYSQTGEIDTNLNGILAVEHGITTQFQMFYNAAPVIYLNNNPGPDASVTRAFELASGKLSAYNPYTGKNLTVTDYLANPVEMNIMHMITGDPARTPTLTLYGNDNLYIENGADNCTGGCTFLDSGFAWNHGDIQPQITTTWLGLVGPGVTPIGIDSVTFSDHADIRPTMMLLLGLKDDYAYEGRALVEYIQPSALPAAIRDNENSFIYLAQAYKQINAPVGQLGRQTLNISTVAMESTNPATYNALENQLICITNVRNNLASQIINILQGAEFSGHSINVQQAQTLIIQANNLLLQVQHLNQGGVPQSCAAYGPTNNSSSLSSTSQPPSNSSSAAPTIFPQSQGSIFSAPEAQQTKR